MDWHGQVIKGVVFALAAAGGVAFAAEWHVAPHGRSDGDGTGSKPWDFQSTMAGERGVAPGDTVLVHGGTYRWPDRATGQMGFPVLLKGTAEQPIRVAAAPGERATIDGGLAVNDPASHLVIEGLEIIVSENFEMSRRVEEPGSHPQSYGRPWGGLNIYSGRGCRFVHLVIHDNAQGVSWWRGATEGELYGCVIYDNGWNAPDRGHGHAVYTQNEHGTGIKRISDCIITGGFGQSMHAYGSDRAFVDGYRIARNIVYDAGRFLVGGGRPSRNIEVARNILHSVDLQLGYSAPHNENCVVAGNVIVNGELRILRFRQTESRDNLVLKPDDPRPQGPPLVAVLPSRDDGKRAHVAVYNWSGHATVDIDTDGFLEPGDKWQAFDPVDLFGKPVAAGTAGGGSITLPAKGEFQAFVLRKRL